MFLLIQECRATTRVIFDHKTKLERPFGISLEEVGGKEADPPSSLCRDTQQDTIYAPSCWKDRIVIRVGDQLPKVLLFRMGPSGPKTLDTAEWFRGKRIVLFALPGAFTPTCSARHLPGYMEVVEEIRGRGVDTIGCLSVNDPYVMDAWGKAQGVGDEITMLSGGAGTFTRAAGFDRDLSQAGFGVRSARYSMIVNDRVVTHLNLEEAGKFQVSDAATILGLLSNTTK